MRKPLGICLALLSSPTLAEPTAAFAGSWIIDLRTPARIQAGVECGSASLDLKQAGSSIEGTHHFATANCGRLDEAGEVSGTANGNEATLEVTSSRNGAIVRGKARLVGSKLQWEALEVVKEGEPEGDQLILQRGILTRQSAP